MTGRPTGSRDLNGRAVRARPPLRRTPRYNALASDFGHTLTSAMQSRQIAASELAAALGLNVGTVLAWRRGRSIPGIPSLVAVATALGCALVDLLPESASYP